MVQGMLSLPSDETTSPPDEDDELVPTSDVEESGIVDGLIPAWVSERSLTPDESVRFGCHTPRDEIHVRWMKTRACSKVDETTRILLSTASDMAHEL